MATLSLKNNALLVLCLSFLFSCRVVKEPVERSDAIRYYLNQRDYESAITLLKQELIHNPADDSIRIILASAYSGSVGLNTIDSFEVLRPKLFDKPVAQQNSSLVQNDTSLKSPFPMNIDNLEVFALNQASEELTDKTSPSFSDPSAAILAIEKELYKFALQSTEAMEIAFRLPHIQKSGRNRLLMALSLLGDITATSDEYQSAQLYSALISLVQFMNYLRDALPATEPSFNLTGKSWYVAFFCRLEFGVLLPNLSKSVDFLQSTFQYLKNANRNSANPIYTNLSVAGQKFETANRIYLENQDLFELVDWSTRAGQSSVCQ